MIELFPYQAEGAEWLSPRPAALLTDEMGLGKTAQALRAAAGRRALLVVCPASVKGVWARETRIWRPDLEPRILEGRDSFRWPRDGELLITNYEILPPILGKKAKPLGTEERLFVNRVTTPAGAPPRGVVLIGDEAHLLKNSRAERSRRFRVLRYQVVHAKGSAWGLTGTPLAARPMDLWGVLRAFGLERQAFTTPEEDRAWILFRRCFRAREVEQRFKGGRGETRKVTVWDPDGLGPRPETAALLKRVAKKRRRAQVLEQLPGKRYEKIEVTSTASFAWSPELEAGLEEMARGETGQSKLVFEELSTARRLLAAGKIPALLELVESYEEAGEPLVVFSAHRPPIDELERRVGWRAIHGNVPNEERTRVEDAYQAGKLRGVALTIGAGGTGLTLTRGASVIFVDRAWNPSDNLQAEDRVCRIGQRRGVLVTELVSKHPIDDRVQEILASKLKLYQAADTSRTGFL